MKTNILFGDCVAVDFYELDDNGNYKSDEPKYTSNGDGFYIVEVWTDEYHCAFTKIFETFVEAKAYANEMKGDVC